MLNRRTQILFDEEMYQRLISLSHEKEISMGELVRNAVKRTYKQKWKKKTHDERSTALIRMLKLREKIRRKYGTLNIPVKELIRQGQRYNEDLDY